MEKLRIGAEFYNIEKIDYDSANVLKIRFASGVNVSALDFPAHMELYTAGFMRCSEFDGFTTVYKQDENTVYLSNDGTVFKEQEPQTTITVELTEEEKAEAEAKRQRQEQITEITAQIAEVDTEFKALDYIGIKIATGRAKKADYTKEIEHMNELADKKNELESKLVELKGEE